MKFMKILLPLVFVLASAPSFAVDAAITKTASPGVIIVTNGGTGLAQFNILSANFPSGTLSKTKTLLGIDWQTTLYPNNPGETVQLCYYRPYSSTEVDAPRFSEILPGPYPISILSHLGLAQK